MSGSSVTYNEDQLWTMLSEVIDPEIPVLNVVEMGIVRGVSFEGDKVIVKITPTYSGCPAMNAIERAVTILKINKEQVVNSGKVSPDMVVLNGMIDFSPPVKTETEKV